MWFLRRPAEKPAFQCGLEVRVQFRDSKLTKIADFRHFDTVNKSRKFIEAGTERPAKIRSCNVPTRLSKSPAIHLQCQLCAPSPDFAFTSPQPSPKRTAIAIDDRGACLLRSIDLGLPINHRSTKALYQAATALNRDQFHSIDREAHP